MLGLNNAIRDATDYTVTVGGSGAGNEAGWMFFKHGDGNFISLVLSSRSVVGIFIYRGNLNSLSNVHWYQIK